MTGFARFGKRWANTGAVMDPSDAQADAGFAFLGATPPSVEMFNAVLQDLDDKDNTLFAWIAAVLTAAGITPADASPGQLLAALAGLRGFQTFDASDNFTVSPGVTKVRARVVGGGCGGGRGTTSQAATGGSAGGYAEGIYTVTPGQVIPITIGLGGAGATAVGNNGLPGGTSSFGAFCSATGAVAGASLMSGGSPGIGVGGTITNATGGAATDVEVSISAIGGSGGDSVFGGGGRMSTTNGVSGLAPGAGGGGTYGGAPGNGGAGAAGVIIVEW